VTFALTADRLVSWLTYPIAGRLSDRTQSRVGRRTPYMAGSLMVLGVSTWMFTVVHGYWLLVLMILIAGQAAATFTLTNVAVVPEVFGRSRWIKALLMTTVLGTVASLAIKGTVIASWKQNDPSTWNLPFQVAAVIMVVVGILVLVLVRESPTARYGAEADRKQRARPTRDELREILAGPNAKVLVAGSLLFWSGVGSTAYVAILFFQRILHAGASAQTIAGLVTGLPVFLIGTGLSWPWERPWSERSWPGCSTSTPTSGRRWCSATSGRRSSVRTSSCWPPSSCSCSPGVAVWASGWACSWPRSTCAAWSWPTSPPSSSTPRATTG
jgi:MFS family permease